MQVLTATSMIPYIISASAACAGIHSRYCTPTQQIRFAKIVFVIQLLYLASISSVKISLLLFYKRVFPGKYFGYIVTVTLGLSGIWFLAFFFAQLAHLGQLDLQSEWTLCLDHQRGEHEFVALWNRCLCGCFPLTLPRSRDHGSPNEQEG